MLTTIGALRTTRSHTLQTLFFIFNQPLREKIIPTEIRYEFCAFSDGTKTEAEVSSLYGLDLELLHSYRLQKKNSKSLAISHIGYVARQLVTNQSNRILTNQLHNCTKLLSNFRRFLPNLACKCQNRYNKPSIERNNKIIKLANRELRIYSA